ncbi:hypothetical protein ALC56_02613 [Trachymyrmex septentrionalis]|uniref:Uncharacterized protein n=1 Tax=Trachymyrmex septentrionalis TaxID=34720 RepID=A0A195FQV4_9HYME|nr:hypothetical protein ALC56_02613 [Trachymyrmex septentrionalis]
MTIGVHRIKCFPGILCGSLENTIGLPAASTLTRHSNAPLWNFAYIGLFIKKFLHLSQIPVYPSIEVRAKADEVSNIPARDAFRHHSRRHSTSKKRSRKAYKRPKEIKSTLPSSSTLITTAKRKDLTEKEDVVLWNKQIGNLWHFRYIDHPLMYTRCTYIHACAFLKCVSRKTTNIYFLRDFPLT